MTTLILTHGVLAMSVAPPSGQNRIMIYGPKPDGTYIVEFRIANGEWESDYAATADAGSNEAVTAQRVNLDPKCALNRWPPATSSAAVSAHRLKHWNQRN